MVIDEIHGTQPEDQSRARKRLLARADQMIKYGYGFTKASNTCFGAADKLWQSYLSADGIERKMLWYEIKCMDRYGNGFAKASMTCFRTAAELLMKISELDEEQKRKDRERSLLLFP